MFARIYVLVIFLDGYDWPNPKHCLEFRDSIQQLQILPFDNTAAEKIKQGIHGNYFIDPNSITVAGGFFGGYWLCLETIATG